MNNTAVFDEFVRDRAPSLLRTAYLLTRDHGHAEDLLQTALARSWGAWRRIDGNPEPYVRKILVNTYTSWRGRRWHGERPSAVLPEPVAVGSPHAAVDDRDQVWRALDRLPRQQRAVLVLRYFEDMPEAQIAEALGIPVGSVKSSAARALATLRLDETLRPDLIDLPEAPPAGQRVVAVRERIARQRRRQIVTVAAACVAVLALILAYALGSHLNLRGAHEPIGPGAGAYRDGYRIVASAGGPATSPPSLTWIPTTLDAQVFVTCTLPVAGWTATAYVGDHPVSGVYECPTGGRGGTVVGEPVGGSGLAAAGIRVGVPVVVTLRIAYNAVVRLTPPASTVTLAIGEAASFDEYPLPPRPATLPPLERPSPGQPVLALFGPGTAATVSIPADGMVAVDVRAQTPGFIEITVAGQPTRTVKFWTYGADQLDSVDLGRGARPVSVTVTTEHLTGDWFVALTPEE